jgi:type VI secretion system protein ImpH
VTFREALRTEPWSVDFFAAMREFERSAKDKPRIGDSTVVAEEIVNLGQDPFLAFPASNVADYQESEGGIPRLSARFLGFFGPQGALPLNTTVEAYHWSNSRDPSFARFTDIFSNRFLQLFFRAWADARPIAQFDRPAQDSFFRYVATFAGIGSPAFARRDSVHDIAKATFAGLVSSSVRSASRLRNLIRGVFDVDVDVLERIGSWLSFEPSDRTALGQSGSTLGGDAYLGGRVHSINDKIRIAIRARDLAQYRSFLPSGDRFDELTDLIFFYIGFRFEFDVQLSLPARCAEPARLGVSGQLGWTAWMAPDTGAGADAYLSDARFNPLERRQARNAEEQRDRPRAGRGAK